MLEHEILGDVRARVPLLLLRPLAGRIALWGEFRDELALTRPVIACEARAPSLPTSTRSMARDAGSLLDHLGVRAAHVFGLSLGGMVATWLAIDRPALVRGVVLASAPMRGLDATPRLDFVPPLVRRDRAGIAERVLSARFRREHPAQTREILGQIRVDGTALRTMLLHAGAAALHDTTRVLARLRAPTLCLAGSLDDLISPQAIARFARLLPNARFELIPGVGHDLSLEAPRELAHRVTRFLDELERAPGESPRRRRAKAPQRDGIPKRVLSRRRGRSRQPGANATIGSAPDQPLLAPWLFGDLAFSE